MTPMKCFCDNVTSALRDKAKQQLGETEEVRVNAIKEFKKMLSEKADFYPFMDDNFLLMFLRFRKFNVERSFEALNKYYKFKAYYSGLLTNFKPSEIKSVLELGHITCLEYRDQNDIGMGIMRIGQYDIDNVTPEKIFAAAFIGMEVGMTVEATQIVGYSMILDFAGFDFRKARHYSSPKIAYRLITVIQDCLPARIKAWHLVNEPVYLDFLFNIARKFLNKKTKERIYFHGSDLSSLHKFVSPDILPQEYGGKQGPISKYTKEVIDNILDHEDYIIKINKYGYV